MVYISRAKRRDQVCQSLRHIIEKLEEISSSLGEGMEDITDVNKEFISQKIGEARTLIENIDFGEFESLKYEMESWASNMEGTNLECTSRYETVSETASTLEDIISNLEDISAPDVDMSNLTIDDVKGFADDIKEIADEIEAAVSNAEDVEFPGMYG